MEYLAAELDRMGSVDTESDVMRVAVRAGAVEVRRADALVLRERARKRWPNSEWEIQKTFSGAYVIYAY